MDHFQEIREKLAERELDAMMLTNEANRLYATGFHSTDTDGLALVTRKNTYYFTDSRYTEAAQRVIKTPSCGKWARAADTAFWWRK